MKYEYHATQPMLPQGATSPVMNEPQMTAWLNEMSVKGWEFVGCGQKYWVDRGAQVWWIFRRLAVDVRQKKT